MLKSVAVDVFGMDGIKLKPIHLQRSFHQLIPMEAAKLIDAMDKTMFVLASRHDTKCVPV